MRRQTKGQIIFFIFIIAVLLVLQRYLQGSMFGDGPGYPINHEDNSERTSVLNPLNPPSPGSSGLRRSDRGIVEYSSVFTERLGVLVARGAKSRDPELIKLIQDVLDPPSNSGKLKNTRKIFETPQATEVIELLNKKRGGFFIECGGLDGERSSNTIFLESEYGWTGLLIEMDPHYYTQLLGKNRKSWSINACLSPFDYVIELPFHGDSGGAGRIGLSKRDKQKSVPCFPFESIMLALNQSHVDYFSLDVEGVELNILRTIPFDRITIDLWSVEYGHAEKKNATRDYMIEHGFRVHKDIHTFDAAITLYVEDFIFIRNDFIPPANVLSKV